MTPGFAARRRAEEFNSLVEGSSTEEVSPERYAEFLGLVETMREAAPVEPRAEFVTDLRRQLMTEAATVLTPTAARLTVAPRRNRRERRIAVLIGGFAVVSATTSMAMAAQTALPGDTLYPLKRALENANTTIQIDEDAKGSSLLDHASGRLDEVDELTRQSDDPNADAVTDTLHAFADQASSASDLLIASYADNGRKADIEELRTFTAQSMTALDELETAVPDTARAALIEAAQVINLIDSEAIRLCPSCGGGVAEMPDFDPQSVDDLLDDLGSALAGPPQVDPGKPHGNNNPVSGAPQGDDQTPQRPHQGDQPGQPPVDPPDNPDVDNPPNGAGGNGGTTNGGGGTNVIEALTDRLTGGGDGPRDDGPNIIEQLDDAVSGIVGGLLGN
jgi:hypothetical protein